MDSRIVRVGELVLRELSGILHSRWRTEAVAITLTHAEVAPDLRKARIYYSAIGGREAAASAGKFLFKVRKELKTLMTKNVTLKYTPDLEFVYDYSFERGARVMDLLEELEQSSTENSEES